MAQEDVRPIIEHTTLNDRTKEKKILDTINRKTPRKRYKTEDEQVNSKDQKRKAQPASEQQQAIQKEKKAEEQDKSGIEPLGAEKPLERLRQGEDRADHRQRDLAMGR